MAFKMNKFEHVWRKRGQGPCRGVEQGPRMVSPPPVDRMTALPSPFRWWAVKKEYVPDTRVAGGYVCGAPMTGHKTYMNGVFTPDDDTLTVYPKM